MSAYGDTWNTWFTAAERDCRIGDLLLLAEEAPTDEQKLKAHRAAGLALVDREAFTLARTQFEAALKIASSDPLSQLQIQQLSGPPPEGTLGRGYPRLVFLFTGHMIDKKGRVEPRFPPHKEPVAANAITRAIQDHGADSRDLAICGGASGGDLLFAEGCLERGLHLELYLPLKETAFLANSVSFEKDLPDQIPDTWISRYQAVRNHLLTHTWITPNELGPPPDGRDPYARNNLRQLYTAVSYGPEKVRILALWNGRGGDGPGGTADMIQQAKALGAKTLIIDTKKLFSIEPTPQSG